MTQTDQNHNEVIQHGRKHTGKSSLKTSPRETRHIVLLDGSFLQQVKIYHICSCILVSMEVQAFFFFLSTMHILPYIFLYTLNYL
jgi:hypothetical protein